MKNVSFLRNNSFAHRGLHNNIYPENSIGAFRNALSKNIPIEFDVHLLKDNTIVVFHDDNLKRMTGIDKYLCNVTYEEIKDLKLNNTEYTIPTLEEVLNLIDGKVPIIVELKYDRKIGLLEKKLVKYLDNYNGIFCVKSFQPLIVFYMRCIRPKYIRGLLIGISEKRIINILSHSIFSILLCKPDFISCDKDLYSNKNIRKFNKSKPVLCWTIKNKTDYIECKKKFDSVIYEEER